MSDEVRQSEEAGSRAASPRGGERDSCGTNQNDGGRLEFELKSLKLTRLTVIVSAIAILATIVLNIWTTNRSAEQSDATNRASTEQFRSTSRETYFSNIVAGLGSGSAAVQVTSMRLMTAFVKDVANYDDSVEKRNNGVRDELQTLSAFIRDASGEKTVGLSDYSLPLPIIIDRALGQVRLLVNDSTLGIHDINLDLANLHGMSMEGFKPPGKLSAVGADLRRADLSGADLTSRPASLDGAYFTCANLKGAHLGSATVGNADFFGANLIDADLSAVQGLGPRQLAGAATDGTTRLPPGITPPAVPTVGFDSPSCTVLVDKMTGMEPNMGYAMSMPCPQDVNNWPDAFPVLVRFAGNRQYLVDVCAARTSG